jgi:uncharacterized protein YeaO (DUF488 family)
MHDLKIKRVYEPYDERDGYRILIDRLWPRGISKEKAHLNEWNKDVTPSPALRKWFSHDPKLFAGFKQAYEMELKDNIHVIWFIAHIETLLKEENVTLLYGAKSPTCNHAMILKEWIETHRESRE